MRAMCDHALMNGTGNGNNIKHLRQFCSGCVFSYINPYIPPYIPPPHPSASECHSALLPHTPAGRRSQSQAKLLYSPPHPLYRFITVLHHFILLLLVMPPPSILSGGPLVVVFMGHSACVTHHKLIAFRVSICHTHTHTHTHTDRCARENGRGL